MIHKICKNLSYILAFALVFWAPSLKAQLDKDEKKQLLAELKSFQKNLEAFQALKQQSESAEEKVSSLRSQIENKRAENTQLTSQIRKKDEGIEYLQEQLRKLKGDVTEVNATRQGRGDHECAFSVQIGAYRNQDLTRYMDSHPNFGVELGDNGLKKYTLGFFTSYWEAKSFSKYLDSQGAQTYVVGFYKGERVPDLKDMTQCTF